MNVFQRLWAMRAGFGGLALAMVLGALLWGSAIYAWHSSDVYKDWAFLHNARMFAEQQARGGK